MTIAIGIKCVDGIVIASDSQVEFGRGVAIKRLNANKIYCFGDDFLIAGAGAIAHIRKAVDTIGGALGEKRRNKGSNLNHDECVDCIETTMAVLHKEYNIDRSRFLGIDEQDYFSPVLVYATKVEDEEETTFYSGIIHGDATVEPVEDYATVGSGAAFAEMLLRNLWIPGITVDEAMPAAIYTINQVIEIAPDCGGLTKLGVVQKDTVRILESTEVGDLLQKVRPALQTVTTQLIPRILRGETSEEDITKVLMGKKSTPSSPSDE